MDAIIVESVDSSNNSSIVHLQQNVIVTVLMGIELNIPDAWKVKWQRSRNVKWKWITLLCRQT